METAMPSGFWATADSSNLRISKTS